MQQILSILSYAGMAMVFGALAVRVFKPEWNQYAVYASWTGLALVLLYTIGQWREIVAFFRRRNARYGAIASVVKSRDQPADGALANAAAARKSYSLATIDPQAERI